MDNKDYSEVAMEIEKNMANMDLDNYDDDEGGKLLLLTNVYIDVPVFTSELAGLRDKHMTAEDDDIEDGGSEEVSDFEDDGEGNEGGKRNKGDDNYPSELEDSEDEKEDYTIRKTDSLIVTATAESDHSNLEVYLYDHKTSDLYVHHEIILGSYPLCLEWLPTY
jgi:hypothetical protein